MNKVPRIGTRRRAVFEALRGAGEAIVPRHVLQAAYMEVEPRLHSTRACDMTFGKALKLYAQRTRRGMYKAQAWVLGKELEVEAKEEIKIEVKGPFAFAPEGMLVEVVRPGIPYVPPLNAAPAQNAQQAEPKPQEEKQAPVLPEFLPREPGELIIGDLVRFISESGTGHPASEQGHIYSVTRVDALLDKELPGHRLIGAIDTTPGNLGKPILCWKERFELVEPAREEDVKGPTKRRFYKGARVAYAGGYKYLDTRGAKVGDLFTVRFYGDETGREDENGEFLFLEETPATDGHPDTLFRLWPAPDDEIKCRCGAVSWGRGRANGQWLHLVKEWHAGFRKHTPADEAGTHYLDRPCALTNGKVAFKNSVLEAAQKQLQSYRQILATFEQQAQAMKAGIDELVNQLKDGEKLANQPKR